MTHQKDYRPGAVGAPTPGYGRVSAEGASCWPGPLRFASAERSSILRMRIVWSSRETQTSSAIAFVSRARMMWYSSSEAELRA